MSCPGFSWNFFLLEKAVNREFFLMVFFNIVVFPLSLEIVWFLWLLAWGCWVSSAVVHAPWHLLPGLPPCVTEADQIAY